MSVYFSNTMAADDGKNCEAALKKTFQKFIKKSLIPTANNQLTFKTPHIFTQPVSMSLKPLFDKIDFYEKPEEVIIIKTKDDSKSPKMILHTFNMYPVTRFAVNDALDLILLEPHTIVEAMTGSAIVVGRIKPNKTVEYVDFLGEDRSQDTHFYFPKFLDSYTARVKAATSVEQGYLLDFRFFDLSFKKKELKSLSQVSEYKFRELFSFGDDVYFGKIAETENFVALVYNPVTGVYKKYFEGPLDSATEYDILNLYPTLRAKILNENEILLSERSKDLLINKTENSVTQISLRDAFKHKNDYIRVMNNEDLNSSFYYKKSKEMSEARVQLPDGRKISWRIHASLSHQLFETEYGFVARYSNHPKYGYVLLKYDGTVKELTPLQLQLIHSTVVENHLVGLSTLSRDGSISLEIIPID